MSRRTVGLWLPTRSSLSSISVNSPGMLLEDFKRDFLQALKRSGDFEILDGLDFRRGHIHNGKVRVGDFDFSELDAFFWFGEITRTHDNFDLYLLDAIGLQTTVINGAHAVRTALDKLLTQMCLHRAGIPIPQFLAVSRASVCEAAQALSAGSFIAKPRLGSFGVGITKLASHDDLVDMVDYSEKDIHFVEELVDTTPTEFIGINVIGGKVVLGYGKEACKFRGWKVFDRDRRGGGMVCKHPHPEQERLALRVAEAVGLDLLGVDIIRSRSGQDYVVDVNPFPGLYPELNQGANANVPQMLADLVVRKLEATPRHGVPAHEPVAAP